MPVNLELKAEVDSLEKSRRRAIDAGAQSQGMLMQVDTYFNVQHGRLKLRVLNGEIAELIRYERNEQSDERISTFEKTEVSDFKIVRSMLEAAIGVLVVVAKRRDLFLFKGARIHLDSVKNLGTFLEFEVPVIVQGEAERVMIELRSIFEIQPEQIIRCSYANLLIERNAK